MDEREINEAVANIAKAPLQAFGRELQELVVTLVIAETIFGAMPT